ncbi:NADH:flavin oxidoreductase/NADH oxidase family protein [Novosphingobium sp.]|uniref:NADH:flavin oxidoreductase/NADH oxidase family protein n=1 Tax=Novosphingobium sp. TaxID=1874826 RepID=UPI0035AEB88F
MIEQPLTLPCGAVLPNRLSKAAMTEGLADPRGVPTAELERLYRVWGAGGAGMLLSGNVHVDGDHLERPGNVIIDRPADGAMLDALRRWTGAAKAQGAQFWAQISHAGRQTMKPVNAHPKAPSAVKLGLPGGQFGQPVALTGAEIDELIRRFAQAAAVCAEGGFDGAQIHAAHGYLISQFLSPRANQRTDQWGGSLENRARFLLEVVKATRAAVPAGFAVSVKLNSADFQRGGFAFEDSLQVARWLEAAGVDLIEISGGTYEQPRLLGLEGMEPVEQPGVAASTIAREAYFVDFALAMKDTLKVPLMVTGGFRSRAAMEEALAKGAADVIGLGRPLCAQPDGAARLLAGAAELPRAEQGLALFPPALSFLTRIKALRAIDSFAAQFWFYSQIYALGRSGQTDPGKSVFAAMLEVERTQKAWLKARRS